VRDVNHWYWVRHHPVILVVYDPTKHRAFWLDVQSYAEEHKLRDEDADTITLRVPRKNRLDLRAIDTFRRLSLAEM